ncbi:MAG: N-acetyltransferase family protein [Blastocatellia bacterium]
MTPQFIRATPADIDTLLSLMEDFYAHEGLALDEQMARNALGQILVNEQFGYVFLIETENELAGYAVLTFGFSLEFRGRDAFVDELFLKPGHRGRGLGRQTLEFLAQTCRDLGIYGLHLEVARENITARELYRKTDFMDHDRYLMTRYLSP